YRRVVQIDSDTCGTERLEDLAVRFRKRIELQTNDVQMKARIAPSVLPRPHERKVCKQRIILRRQSVPAFHESIDPAELARAKRGVNVRDAVVISKRNLLVVPRSEVVLHLPPVARDAMA